MFEQMKREAKGTGAALLALIIFWLVSVIMTVSSGISIFNIPLWAIFGTLGVWIFAIFLATMLSYNIKDLEL